MPKLDSCHDQIVRALKKDGWQVADKPFRVEATGRTVFIDVRASRLVNGSRQEIMLAEIKCFTGGQNTPSELYIGLGQYLIYRAILAMKYIEIPVYLAIPADVYDTIFDPVVRRSIQDDKIKLILVDLVQERIVEWKE